MSTPSSAPIRQVEVRIIDRDNWSLHSRHGWPASAVEFVVAGHDQRNPYDLARVLESYGYNDVYILDGCVYLIIYPVDSEFASTNLSHFIADKVLGIPTRDDL